MLQYENIISLLTNAFEFLEQKIAPPIKQEFGGGYVYRYREKSYQQAVIQKLARTITGLRALLLLNQNGLLQEQASLQRVLDELDEDIMFLTFPFLFDDRTELHQKYLDAFYEEEFDIPESAIESTQKRPMISRKKVRAYINKPRGEKSKQSSSIETSRTLSKTYSGYVHCASPQIMELYFGTPLKFQTTGNATSPFYEDHKDDLFNNFFRAIHSFGFASMMLRQNELFDQLLSYSKQFAVEQGKGNNVAW
ncbi:hypothetical protein [Bowmanella sp. JS7-9]|uniref:Uncharacterized protein n=1 Tax=Pseudobowmanella zhangzhouensis TaxID=1537679 RepID=A0ABW1XJG8_9ALTE|nr:hypothetical protein [Bowmanella sp. JS7-9]